MPSILFGDDDRGTVGTNKTGTTYHKPLNRGYQTTVGTGRTPIGLGKGTVGGQSKSDPTNDTTYYGSGGGGGTSAADIQGAYNDELIAARDAELAALEARLQSSIDLYNQQLNQIKANYEGLRDQSEVDRYKSRRALREALANRGQLDSGYGRQEALNADLNYFNQLNAINLQEAQANQEIQNQINQLKADNLANKANIRARYAEALRQ